MDKNEEDILLENAKEYYEGALEAEKKENYNTSGTLYVEVFDKPRTSVRGTLRASKERAPATANRSFDFKSFASLLDYYIYLKKGVIPRSHTDRFRILEKDYPDLYRKIDGDFEFYQKSYRERLTKEACEVLKKDARELFGLLNIKI